MFYIAICSPKTARVFGMLDIHFISEKGKDSLIHEELWNMKTNIDYIWQCAFVTNLVKSTPPWPLTPFKLSKLRDCLCAAPVKIIF